MLRAMIKGQLGPQYWLLGRRYTVSSIGAPAAADLIDSQSD